MEIVKQRVTEDQINEALNPGISKTDIIIGDEENSKSIKIKIMSSRKEPIFIRDLKNIATTAIAGIDTANISIKDLLPLLDNIPAEKIAVVAAQVTANSGESDYNADWLLDNCSTMQQIELITAQVNKQGYLDFLLQAMAKLNRGKAV